MNKYRFYGRRVSWLAFWRHRWIVLNILNQIASGTESDAIHVIHYYGGCNHVGSDLYEAARAIIEVKR